MNSGHSVRFALSAERSLSRLSSTLSHRHPSPGCVTSMIACCPASAVLALAVACATLMPADKPSRIRRRCSGSSLWSFLPRLRARTATDLRRAGQPRQKVLAPIVKACRELPGHELFQYVDATGDRQSVGSADVNAYLRDITGQPFTSKDFRTWGGTVLAACELAHVGRGQTKRRAKLQIVETVKVVARRLGNTVAVCRKCYIHPAVLEQFTAGSSIEVRRKDVPLGNTNGLSVEEKAVVALLRRDLAKAS
jgi:DNA topoisomerase IB